ncbi:MAG: Ig-like domain-containing protein [Lachnospiraceae bacterium]|nr:Ig-like domain-containing protein [Lachnospiraceae bacterium]
MKRKNYLKRLFSATLAIVLTIGSASVLYASDEMQVQYAQEEAYGAEEIGDDGESYEAENAQDIDEETVEGESPQEDGETYEEEYLQALPVSVRTIEIADLKTLQYKDAEDIVRDYTVVNDDTILLPLEKDALNYLTMDLSVKEDGVETWKKDRWTIYPAEAAQQVIYSSSNPQVISVTAEGLVEAHKSGNATITIQAADGSGVKNWIKFRAVTPVRKIEIKDKAGRDRITGGDSLTPLVTFNNGVFTPDDKWLQWALKEIRSEDGMTDLTDALRDAVSVNERTGNTKVQADYGNDPVKITISAVSSAVLPADPPICQDYTFTVLPVQKPFEVLTLKNTGNPVIIPSKNLQFSTETDATIQPKAADFEWFFTAKDADPSIEGNRQTENTLFQIRKGKLSALPALKAESAPVQIDVYARYAYADSAYIVSAPVTVTAYPSAVAAITCPPLQADTLFGTLSLSPVLSGTDGKPCCQDHLTYKSSNPKIATVDGAGIVTAVSNGTAYVTVTAGDQSKKSVKVKVTVAQKPLSVNIAAKDGVKTLGAGKKLAFSADVNAQPGEYPAANKKVGWKITEIREWGGSAVAEADYAKIATISTAGQLSAAKNLDRSYAVKVQAASLADPSVVSPEQTIRLYPLTASLSLTDNAVPTAKRFSRTISAGVPLGTYSTSFTLATEGSADDFTVTAAGADGAVISGEYTVTSTKPSVAVVEATSYDADGFVNKWTIRGLSKGSCTIRVVAADGSGKSASITVNVLQPVTDLQISSKSGCYILAGTCKLQLLEVINADASDRSVQWEIESLTRDGVPVANDGRIAEITNKGLLKAADITTQYVATVKATATDGSGKTDTAQIKLYPYAVTHQVKTAPIRDVKTILTKGGTTIHVDALSFDEKNGGIGSVADKDRAAQTYKVTYTPGAAKVTLNNADGNEVRVTGLKKGSTTVTFTALDGSAKKIQYKINVSADAQKPGWFEMNGQKYYVSPETGEIVTGFRLIDGKLYYFRESGDLEGAMAKGFFYLPSESPFYDGSAHASNRYYAFMQNQTGSHMAGEILTPAGEPWRVIRKDPSKVDSQEWLYYFADRTLTVDGEECVIGEVLAGDWYIKDGTTEYVADIASASMVRRAHTYSFHQTTGARKRTVLYFCGNYYGHVDAQNVQAQKAAVDSIARYFNADEAFKDVADELVYVNYQDRAAKKDGDDSDALQIALQNRLHSLGLTAYDPGTYGTGTVYPMAASEHVQNEKEYDLDPNGWPYLNKIIYKEVNDIAKWNGTGAIAGQDRNVDVLDVKLYAWDVYQRAIVTAGPQNLVLMGASSGGGTVLALCKWAQMTGVEQPAQAILLSPWLDVALDNPDARETDGNNGTDRATLQYWGARYTRDPEYTNDENIHPYAACAGPGVEYDFASPFNYSEYALDRQTYANSFSGLTTHFYIFAGVKDPCYADTQLFAGVAPSCTLKSYAGRPHGYMFHAAYDPDTTKTLLAIADIIMAK